MHFCAGVQEVSINSNTFQVYKGKAIGLGGHRYKARGAAQNRW